MRGREGKDQNPNTSVRIVSFRFCISEVFSLCISKINNYSPIVNPNLNNLNAQCSTWLQKLKRKQPWCQAVVKGLRFLDAGLPWSAAGLENGKRLTEGQKTTSRCHEWWKALVFALSTCREPGSRSGQIFSKWLFLQFSLTVADNLRLIPTVIIFFKWKSTNLGGCQSPLFGSDKTGRRTIFFWKARTSSETVKKDELVNRGLPHKLHFLVCLIGWDQFQFWRTDKAAFWPYSLVWGLFSPYSSFK